MILTNTEFILSLLINENSKISGYKINKLIEERGYREWAGIGTTSIYKGLKKLEKIRCIKSQMDIKKKSKGPVGKLFTQTDLGKTYLLEELRSGLSETREHDPRFKIAISGIELLKQTEVYELLGKKLLFLKAELTRLNNKKQLIKHAPFKVQMLFEHSLRAIKNEKNFTNYLIKQYKLNKTKGDL